MKESVVLVHGLWMTGAEMALLRRRLSRCGYRTYQFRYRSLRRDLSANAHRLHRFLATVPGDTVHLVGHSLGGLVIRKLFQQFPQQRPGRIVTLGTPHNASAVARYLRRFRAGRVLLGRSAQALCSELTPWEGVRELGVIAGTLALGMGRFLVRLPSNDGVVAVEETSLENATDRIDLPVSHMGLIVAASVAAETCHFLQHGRFSRNQSRIS
ncbi:esterase/lipase family protein [Thiohalomonas denitrificans]|uniref:Alpha/beta hydrolase family protein n=1 Tax=Thiohalomonas denitrificans TaxID=415747 RepID=A0A1G5PL16_9GAMM|nr:alpha/beta fold hydrolase [Thiohalomonas denitrificans]SCZ50148.1 Alpha/beta hydrolase family protein [Thiohalomonas denitrificans]